MARAISFALTLVELKFDKTSTVLKDGHASTGDRNTGAKRAGRLVLGPSATNKGESFTGVESGRVGGRVVATLALVRAHIGSRVHDKPLIIGII